MFAIDHRTTLDEYLYLIQEQVPITTNDNNLGLFLGLESEGFIGIEQLYPTLKATVLPRGITYVTNLRMLESL